MTIRILIADDHAVVAEGLRSLIGGQGDMEVVGLAGDGREAVMQSLEKKPDVVVMDNAMPVLNGTEAARIISKRCAHTRIVMLSMHSNSMHIHRALQAGAGGYVLKESVGRELVDAIRAVHAGRRYLSKPLADDLLDRLVTDVPENPLSSQEKRVLALVADGKTNKEIAVALGLSDKTVKNYLSRIFQKLQVGRRAHAAAVYRRSKLD